MMTATKRDFIVRAMARQYDVTYAEIMSRSRDAATVAARHHAIFEVNKLAETKAETADLFHISPATVTTAIKAHLRRNARTALGW